MTFLNLFGHWIKHFLWESSCFHRLNFTFNFTVITTTITLYSFPSVLTIFFSLILSILCFVLASCRKPTESFFQFLKYSAI